MFVEVTVEKLIGGGGFLLPPTPPPSILNRVKAFILHIVLSFEISFHFIL